MTWRSISDWAKRAPLVLRIADRLGRGRGEMRFFDRLIFPPSPRQPGLERFNSSELAAIWIGHATILLRIGGLTILTDPVFSNRIGLGLGLMTGGPARHMGPAISLRQLPKIDLVLVSHAHFDHLDRPTLYRLSKRMPVITAENTTDLIADLGFVSVSELRWGESMSLGPLKITGQKLRHLGARTFFDRHRGFTGFLIEAGRRRVLFGGDCAFCDYFSELGRVDLAVLGIGGYDPWIGGHANPEQAWEMANQMRADHVLPMHHSTFRLSHEPMDEPIARLMDVAGPRGRDRIAIDEIGGQWEI